MLPQKNRKDMTVTYANRVAALVAPLVTCVVMAVRMLQCLGPLKCIQSALICGFIVAALSWTVTVITASVLSDAYENRQKNKELSGERKE